MAAASLVSPRAIASQNRISCSRRATEGRPGDQICPRRIARIARNLSLVVARIATPFLNVLRRLVESAQYLAIRYTERLADAGAVRSVGSRGDSYDNALAESVVGLFKTELIRMKGPWRILEQVELATARWVDWYNNRRLHTSIGNLPPAEYEAAYYAERDGSAVA